MGNLNPNSTNYFHSYEPNTNDLTMAMDYNPLGQPALRTIFTPTALGAVAGPAAMNAGTTYLYIGGDQTGGTFIGDIGEVILFKKALNATEYANVENYLSTKWGI